MNNLCPLECGATIECIPDHIRECPRKVYKQLLRNMFDKITTRIIMNKTLSEKAYMKKGFGLGSVLSPVLFNIMLNE